MFYVINQGLFYLDWLLDHKAEFELMVMRRYGQQVSDTIEWSSPRLLCIAGGFTKYDVHAVQQINRNIELYRVIFYCSNTYNGSYFEELFIGLSAVDITYKMIIVIRRLSHLKNCSKDLFLPK